MDMLNWRTWLNQLARRLGLRRSRIYRRRNGFRPNMLPLEDRLTPAVTITAVKAVDLVVAHPGDTLTYTFTGSIDATGVQLVDLLDPDSTFVMNSVKLSPVATGHLHASVGNTPLSVVNPAISLTPTPLPQGTSGSLYTQSVTATGGTTLPTFSRQVGSSAGDGANGVAVDDSGNVYIVGYTSGTLAGQSALGVSDAFVQKFDANGSLLWTRQFGSSGYDIANGVALDSSGNIYVVGQTDGTLSGQNALGGVDAFVQKFDANGSFVWIRQFGSSANDVAYGVAANAAGDVYVAGYTTGTLAGQSALGRSDAFVRKFDANGSTVWTSQFGSSANDGVWQVTPDAAGNVYVSGYTAGTLAGQSALGGDDAFVRKFDAAGATVWTRQFGSSASEGANRIAADAAGNVYVSGYTTGTLGGQTSSGGGSDAFVQKFDAAGATVWTRQFGSSTGDLGVGVSTDAAGNVYVAGYTEGILAGQNSAGSGDAFVRKFDANGSLIWTHQFGSPGFDEVHGLATDAAGNVYVTGVTTGAFPGQTFLGGEDAFVVKNPFNNNLLTVGNYNDGGTGLLPPTAGPNSLAFNSTPTAAGTVTFDVTATDAAGATATRSYSLTINQVLAFSPTTLPTANADVFFTQAFTVNGGTTSYGTTVLSNLVAGATGLATSDFRLGAGTATVSFTPAAGTATFDLTVTDAAGATKTQSYSISIVNVPQLGALSTTAWTVGQAFSATVAVTGNGPFTNLRQANLPAGLTAVLSGSTIAITGIPTTTGVFNTVQLSVDDAGSNTRTGTYAITINPAITLAASPLPQGTAGALYSQSITATGGTGLPAFTRQIGTSLADLARGVVADAAGNVYVVGYTDGSLAGQTSAGGGDAFVQKFDAAGALVWTRQFGTPSYDEAFGVAVDGSGNVYVAGATEGLLPGQAALGGFDAFVRKFDAAGSTVWTRQFGTSVGDFVSGIAVDAAGNPYVSGYTDGTLAGQTSAGSQDAFVRKFDAAGSTVWTTQFGSSAGDLSYGIAVDAAGNAYVSGTTNGTLAGQTSAGGQDAFVRKFNASGSPAWTRQFGSSMADVANSVAVDGTGNVYVSGYTAGTLAGQTSVGNRDAFVEKFDTGGAPVWTRQFGSPAYDEAYAVAVDLAGNVHVAGTTVGSITGQTSSGYQDAFVQKLDANGVPVSARQFGSPTSIAYDVDADAAGNVYVVGNTRGALPGQTYVGNGDAFVFKNPFDGKHLTVSNYNDGGTGLQPPISGINPLTFASTPSAAGTVTFDVTATDAAGAQVTTTYSITINAAPAIGNLTQTTWIVGQSGYDGTLTVSTGTAPYTLSAQSGLPTGLTAVLTGSTISFTGTPTSLGTFASASVTVADAAGAHVTKTFSITIVPPNATPTAIALNNATLLPNAGVNAVVGNLLTTDPDTGNTFTYEFVAGANNNGLFTINGEKLQTNANLDYSTLSSFTIRVKSTDQGGLSTTQDITITNPTTVKHGSTPTVIDLNAAPTDVDTILLDATLTDPLYETKRQYGLGAAPVYFNAWGFREKYLPTTPGKSPNNLLVLLPNGELRLYDGGTTAGGGLIDTLSPSVYDNPDLLLKTIGLPLVTVPNPLYAFKAKYGLDTPAGYFNNSGKLEYYLHSSNNSNQAGTNDYILTSSNTLVARGSNTLVADFAALGLGNIWEKPSLLTSAVLETTVGVTAFVTPKAGPEPGGTVTITALPGFDRAVNVRAVSLDGVTPAFERSFVFTVNNTVPAIGVIANQTGDHRTPLAIPLAVNDRDPDTATRTYSVEISNPLFDVRTQYGLVSTATAADPARGGAKFLFSRTNGNPGAGNNYFAILPDNKLYKDNGSNPPVFVLDLAPFGNVYANPALLTAAAQQPPTAVLNRGELFDLKAKYGLDTAPAYFNARGGKELYFKSSNGSNPAAGQYSYMIKPDGLLYAFDGSATPTGTVVADVGTEVYFNPALLTAATPTQIGDLLFDLKTRYGLDTIAFEGTGIAGADRYLKSSNGSNGGGYSYFLRSDGWLYARGSTNGTGTRVAFVGVDVFGNPDLLYNATGQAAAVTWTVSNGTLTLTPNAAFTGTVRVTVKANDGAAQGTQSFLYTVTNTAPGKVRIQDQTVSPAGAAGSFQIDLATALPDADPLSYKIAVADWLVDLKTKFGLNTPSTAIFPARDNARFFLGGSGINQGGSRYFLIKPVGNQFQLLASDGSTSGGTVILADVGEAVYNNPALLTGATTPPTLANVTTNVAANTLTIAWPSGYTGKFWLSVFAFDGDDETRQSFLVTIS